MATPKSELMRRLREEKRRQGLSRLEVWAPKEAHDEIKRAAAEIVSGLSTSKRKQKADK